MDVKLADCRRLHSQFLPRLVHVPRREACHLPNKNKRYLSGHFCSTKHEQADLIEPDNQFFVNQPANNAFAVHCCKETNENDQR